MNAALLLEHYGRIVDAPDAIPRLRRFILDLAVRGKLVEQDPNDEPALELLKRIAEEKARLVEAGELKASKRSPTKGSFSSGLPEGWTQVTVEDIAACLDYQRIPINASERAKRIEGKPLGQLYPYYGATQQQGWIDDFLFDDELVLLGEDGIPFFDPLRSKAYLIEGRTWVNNHAHVFKGILISNRFLVHYLNAFDYSGRVVGATRAKLNQAQALEIPIDLPPLAEQHRIVAKVDELMAICEQLAAVRADREVRRDKLTAASLAQLNAPDPETFANDARFALDNLAPLTTRPDQIKQLRQTILNLAVRGKLVEQDANDELASELHSRLIEKFAGKPSHKQRGGRSALATGLIELPPYVLPNGWTWCRMGELGETNVGLTYSPNDVSENGVPVLRSNNIQAGKMDLSGLVRVTSTPKASVMVHDGDILICARNGSRALVGKAAIIEYLPEPMAFGAFMAIFRSPLNRYLNLFIASPVFRQVIDEVNTTTINQITQANLRSTLVPLPPLAEQNRIVAKVDELMALCGQLEASLANSDQARSRLFGAVLQNSLEPA